MARQHWRRSVAAAAAAALLRVFDPQSAAADEAALLRVELRPRDYAATEAYLLDVARADVSERDAAAGTLELVVEEGDLPTLWLLGEVSILERSRPFAEIAAERLAEGIDMPEEQYKTYPEVLAILDSLEAQYPAIARKVNLTEMFGMPQTWEGRDIWALKISDNVAAEEDELAILFDSLHHARELNTMEVTIDLMVRLTDAYGSNPIVTSIVDAYEIWVVPVVNPDGLQYVWSNNNLWRKNRRNNGGNVFGVDLNRNYPFKWGVCGNVSTNPSSAVYRGPAPLTEPEVQTMVALGEWLRPTMYITFHSKGQEVQPPYTCATLAEPQIVNRIRDLYRARMNYAWVLSAASGMSFEWFYNQVSSLAYLTEMGTEWQPPFSETRAEVARVRPGWIFLLEAMAIAPLVEGHVTDAVSGEPIEADIASSRISFSEGERRSCESDYGRYSWFLPLEAQTLTFSAPGYQSKQVPTFVTLGTQTVDVELDPEP